VDLLLAQALIEVAPEPTLLAMILAGMVADARDSLS
jgi:hypothetical protein